jgi:hypothetical protein
MWQFTGYLLLSSSPRCVAETARRPSLVQEIRSALRRAAGAILLLGSLKGLAAHPQAMPGKYEKNEKRHRKSMGHEEMMRQTVAYNL